MSTESPLAAKGSDTKYKRRYWTLAVLSISLIVIALDVTILNVAIPTLQRDLGASAAELQWILNAYILVFAGLLLTMGTLGDRFGRRRALETGLIVFGIASLLAAYSQTSGQLIAARAAQGIGGAMIMPSTLSVLVDVFPREERAKAIGIWVGAASIGIPLGMVVGGWLLENFWWGTAFLINLPVVIAALVFGRVLVPESRDPEARKIDLIGATISMFALTALVYTIIEAPGKGWLDPVTLGGFVLVAVAGAAFVRYELGQNQPMLDVRVFKNARLSSGALAIAIMSMAMLAVMFLLTQYLQFVQGYSPLDTGIRLVPMAVGFMFGAPMSTILVGRIGTKWTVTMGLLILAAAVTALSGLDVTTTYWVAGISLFFFGMGMANTMAPATDAVMAALARLPRRRRVGHQRHGAPGRRCAGHRHLRVHPEFAVCVQCHTRGGRPVRRHVGRCKKLHRRRAPDGLIAERGRQPGAAERCQLGLRGRGERGVHHHGGNRRGRGRGNGKVHAGPRRRPVCHRSAGHHPRSAHKRGADSRTGPNPHRRGLDPQSPAPHNERPGSRTRAGPSCFFDDLAKLSPQSH
jgi:EmrB/QacA subfamily drug resistance transporter